MTKHHTNWIISAIVLLVTAIFISLSATKIMAAQEESLRLDASNTGCIFGILTVADDEKHHRKDKNYTAEEDMKRIDFSTWNLSKKDIPVFKNHFQQAMIACYKRYV